MKAPRFSMVVAALLAGWVIGAAYAKLPAAPVDPAKAEAAKMAAAAAAKKEAEALAKAQDRVAERYKREKGVKTAGAAAPRKKK